MKYSFWLYHEKMNIPIGIYQMSLSFPIFLRNSLGQKEYIFKFFGLIVTIFFLN